MNFPEGFFEQMPPEVAAAVQAHAARLEMTIVDTVHEMNRFLESLDIEQIAAFENFLLRLYGKETDSIIAYWRGRVAAVRHYRDDICPCGTNHNAAEFFKAEAEPEPEPEPEQTEFATDAQTLVQAMLEYNLSSDGERIFCKGCNTVYQSIEDRQKRPPGVEGCGGCRHKQAWG